MNEIYNISLIVLTALVDFLFLFRFYTNTQVLKFSDPDTLVQYFCRRIPTKELIFFLVGVLNPLVVLNLNLVESLGIGLAVYFILHRLFKKRFLRYMRYRSISTLSAKSIRIISINNDGKGIGVMKSDSFGTKGVKVDIQSVSNKSYAPGDSAKVVGIDYTTLLIE